MHNNKKLYSIKEMAKIFKVNKDIIYRWIRRNHIPGFPVGKQIKFNLSEIEKWVEKR